MHKNIRVIDTFILIVWCIVFVVIALGGFAIPLDFLGITGKRLDISKPSIFILLLVFLYWLRYRIYSIKFSFEKFFSKEKLILILAISATWVFVAHLFKHWSFSTHGWDVAFVNQSIFYAFSNPPLSCSICLNQSYFGEHSSFTFFIFAPLLTFVKSSVLLYLIQVLLPFYALFLLFKYGPLKEKKLWGLGLLVIFSSASFRNSLIWDFREDILAFTFLTFALVAVDSRKFAWAYISLTLASLSKENVAFIVIFLSFTLFVLKHRKLALFSLLTSIGIILFNFKFFIPMMTIGKVEGQTLMLRFAKYGANPQDVVINVLTTPRIWWELLTNNVFTFDRFKYVFYLCAPAFIIGRKYYIWLFPVAAGLAMNILPEMPNQRMMIFHYDLVILPFLFYMILKGLNDWDFKNKSTLFGVLIALVLMGRSPSYHIQKYWPSFSDIKNSLWLNNLELNAPVASNLKTMAQIVHLPQLRILPDEPLKEFKDYMNPDGRSGNSCQDAAYYILDLNQRADRSLLKLLSASSNYSGYLYSPDRRFVIMKRN